MRKVFCTLALFSSIAVFAAANPNAHHTDIAVHVYNEDHVDESDHPVKTSKDGELFVPHELRRIHKFRTIASKRRAIESQMETAKGAVLLRLQNELLELDQKEHEHREGVEADVQEHHKFKVRAAELNELILSEMDPEKKYDLEQEMRMLERSHAEIRMRHIGMSPEEMEEMHELREAIQQDKADFRHNSVQASDESRQKLKDRIKEKAQEMRKRVERAMRRTHNEL
jgi:hypothetical protein